jgi:hypothetical protein
MQRHIGGFGVGIFAGEGPKINQLYLMTTLLGNVHIESAKPITDLQGLQTEHLQSHWWLFSHSDFVADDIQRR